MPTENEPTHTTPKRADLPVPSKAARPVPTPSTNDLDGLARIEQILIGSTLDEANRVLAPAGWWLQVVTHAPRVVMSSEGRYDRIRVDVVDGRITAFKIG